jgi:hypothetical protein
VVEIQSPRPVILLQSSNRGRWETYVPSAGFALVPILVHTVLAERFLSKRDRTELRVNMPSAWSRSRLCGARQPRKGFEAAPRQAIAVVPPDAFNELLNLALRP